jgi:ferredoxin-nitrite reductase
LRAGDATAAPRDDPTAAPRDDFEDLTRVKATPKPGTPAGEFAPEQKHYLEGFASGLQLSRTVRGATPAPVGGAPPIGPDAAHLQAQDRALGTGAKLSDPEKFKRALNPFDAYGRLKAQAAANEAPKVDDNFRWRFFGLFYCAPTEQAYMCRLRIPNGILTHWQLGGLAELAQRYGDNAAAVTTRANLQIRKIAPKDAVLMLEAIQDLGLTSRGAGADNIRNVTGSPTAGIDPQELIDTRSIAREWHFHILNDRSLYGLPRKFNVGFDGGGLIPVLEDTNDIGFTALALPEGLGPEPGVYFRLAIGGITGHKDFATPTGVLVKPADAVAVADAIVRVFIDRGDRTDRKKARLKYVLDKMGFAAFLAEVEARLGRPLTRVDADKMPAANRQHRQHHIGVHAQRQPGLVWVGVALPVGRIGGEQMRALAAIAREFGDGDIRLTVWQNLLLSGVARARAEDVEGRLQAIGLSSKASSVRAGLIACTGNTGCKFALANTKATALAIAAWVEGRVALDGPINIHLTGCPNSCAQHYIGDLGLLACRIAAGAEDTIEGFHVFIGGGFGSGQAIGRELYREVPVEDCPQLVERILHAYIANRRAEETFPAFAARHDVAALKAMIAAQGGSA